jgi:uncharacterized protein
MVGSAGMTNTSAGPANGRIHIIDAIRGLAILGILFANIHSWSGYKYIPLESIETLPFFQFDPLFLQLQHWLVDGKFYAIFSMLFGAGFGLQYMKNQQNQPLFISKYRRRLSFLLLFGVLHALLWSGDILTLYALLAFVLVLLRNIPLDSLLALALALLAFFALPQMADVLWADPPVSLPRLAHKNYSDMAPEVLTATFGAGGWAEVFTTNLHNLYWRWMDFLPNGRITRVLGMFVLGFYLSRSGYFTSGIYSVRRLLLYLVLGIAATAASRYMGTNISTWATSGVDVLMKVVLVSGQVFLALAYMSVLAQVFRFAAGEKLLYPLTLVGRMAFTCYLLQTVIGIIIFYGIGFGQWGTMGLAQLWLLALIIYSVQVGCCSFWLRFFRQGPVEWLWACLTDGEFKPNRLSHA